MLNYQFPQKVKYLLFFLIGFVTVLLLGASIETIVVNSSTRACTQTINFSATSGVQRNGIEVDSDSLNTLNLHKDVLTTLSGVTTDSINDWDNMSASGVTSFKGRTGGVVPASGDYTADSITQSADYRFSTDTEKSTWNAKVTAVYGAGLIQSTGGTTPTISISQDADNRLVTDTEKATWNSKEAGGTTATHAGLTGTAVHGLGTASTHADTEYEDAGAVTTHESTYDHPHYNEAYLSIPAGNDTGNVFHWSGVDNKLVPLAPGDTGKVLTAKGTGVAPAWETATGGHGIVDANGDPMPQQPDMKFATGFSTSNDTVNHQTVISIDTLADSVFVDGNLTAGVLTVPNTHTIAAIVDNNGKQVYPDIGYGATSTTVDLSLFGTLTGNWYVKYAQGLGESGMVNPMDAAGDLIVGGVSGTPTKLAKGSGLQVLRMNSGGTAQEWATPSGGGMWALISRVTIADSAASSYTFSSLAGNTDRRYRLVARIKNSYNGEIQYAIKINGDTTVTDYMTQRFAGVTSVTGGHQNNIVGLNAGYSGELDGVLYIEYEIDAVVLGTGFTRFARGGALYHTGSTVYQYVFGGGWKKDAAEEITSLTVLGDGTNTGIAVGSCFELWKLAQ
jgi:hypothetical protein